LIELIVSSLNKRSLRIQSLLNLKVELTDIKEAIDNSCNEDTLIIDIPIWETFVQSGGVFLFSRKKYYLDLLRTYSKIKFLIEQEKDEQCDLEEIIEYRKDVKCDIERLLLLL